ncbi:MAG: ornithine cyclodeaminase family protein [Alphaproteobacteria bacterium]|nr:ornithine cyclodeaminase family protein [Alphaproteobacteria bacterium]
MLFIHNDVAHELLTMADCIEVQDRAFRDQAEGTAAQKPRSDIYAPCDLDHGYYRGGTVEGYSGGYFAVRIKSDIITWPVSPDGSWNEDKHCIAPGTYCGLVILYATATGEPLAIINDGIIQHMRVGASAALGARYLAREDAATVGMLGSGGMARTYLEGFCAVRDIRAAKVFSPTRANRDAFAAEMSDRLGIAVAAVDSPQEALAGADIVSTCTSSMTPTLKPEWLSPGQHVTMLGPSEVDDAVLEVCDVRIAQAAEGGMDAPGAERGIGHSAVAWVAGTAEERKRLPAPKTGGRRSAFRLPDFCDLVTGRAEGRTAADQITFYRNLGNQGLQFSSVGGLLYEKAVAAKKGRSMPTEWFLEDIRD